MSTVVARALTIIAMVFQSYFNWDRDHVSDGGLQNSKGYGMPSGYHLAGLVLARGGSKGIPKKNLVEVDGRPLVGRALDSMVQSGVFTSIWVSTDDDEISNWVRSHYSKETVAIHKRAAYTATDTATSMTAVLEFLSLHPEIDAIGLVQATSPFVQSEYLKKAAVMLLKLQYDSVFSVTRSHQLRWSVMHTREKKKEVPVTRPINFNPRSRPRRQDWEGEMVENGMFYFALRTVLVDSQVFQAHRSGYVEVPKHLSLEIDTVEDLELARCLVARFNGSRMNKIGGGWNREASQTLREL